MATATIIHAPTASVPVPEPQTRGYVLNLVRSLSRHSLELEIRRAGEAGFNLLIFPVFSNGWTLFPSEAMLEYKLPAINPLFRKWNPLAEAVRIAAEVGMAVWAFARSYNFHPRYSIAEHRLLRKRPEWRLRTHPLFNDSRHRQRENWHPCPINPAYRRFVGDVLTELAAAYPVEGLVLDYTEFGLANGSLEDWPFCFCQRCQQLYRATFNGNLIEDAAADKMAMIRGWQLELAHENLVYLRHRMLRARRTLRLVCQTPPGWRDSPRFSLLQSPPAVLMNWAALLATGEIEELLVTHDRESIPDILGNRLAADYAYLGDRVLFLPLLSLDSPDALGESLEVIGRYPIPGFVAEFQKPLTQEAAAQTNLQLFPEPAPLPEAEPVRTAIYLLERVRLMHESQPRIHDLITDFLRLLVRQINYPTDFVGLQVIEQNIHGLEQFIRRGRLKNMRIPESTLRDLGLARRFVRMACMDVRS